MKELGPCEVQGHFSLALAEKTQHSTTVWLGPTQLQGYRPSHRQGPGESRYQPPPGRRDGSESRGGVGVPWPAFGVQVLPLPNAEPLGQMASLTFRTQAQLQTLATLAPFPSSRAITSGEESIVVLRGEERSRVTCVTTAHIHVCHLLPSVCPGIVNLDTLPHQGSVVSPSGIQLSAEYPNA